MKGRLPGASESRDAYRDLLAEVVLAAIRDARRGNREAKAWLRDGAGWVFDALDVTPPADDAWLRKSANVRE